MATSVLVEERGRLTLRGVANELRVRAADEQLRLQLSDDAESWSGVFNAPRCLKKLPRGPNRLGKSLQGTRRSFFSPSLDPLSLRNH